MTTVQSDGSQNTPGASGWIKSHLALVAGATVTLVLIVVVGVAIVAATGSKQGKTVAPGSLVGTAPLTTGYRLTGKILKHSPATISVHIIRVDASGGEARNLAIRPDKDVDFATPAEGIVSLARNGHEIPSPTQLHDGDQIALAGEFTMVVVPPAPPHEGYAFFNVEASAK